MDDLDDLISRFKLKIIQYWDPCEWEVNGVMYCALPPGKDFDRWPKSGSLSGAVRASIEKIIDSEATTK